MAVKRPPMIKLPSERIASPLDIARKNAKGARKEQALQDLYNEYGYDEVVCFNLANNKYIGTEVREKLAMHKNPGIRITIAKNSERISDEKVLRKLAQDLYEIRKEVARTTTNDSIKRLLFVTNPHHIDIRKTCIKRLTDMCLVERLVFSRKPESTAPMFVDSITDNRNLNYRICLLVLKYAERLSGEQIELINQYIIEHQKSVVEILDSITTE